MSHKPGRDKRAKDKHAIAAANRLDFKRILETLDILPRERWTDFTITLCALALAKRRRMLPFFFRMRCNR